MGYYVYVLEEQQHFDLDKKSLASMIDMITYDCPRGEDMKLTVLCVWSDSIQIVQGDSVCGVVRCMILPVMIVKKNENGSREYV
mmetsp:Transcript_54048/g.61416  ORF Transcript_54048/g.61416 Transcript_54048/m.61416 type:complete len:84 (-) Transcript_54048:1379-1630(-)